MELRVFNSVKTSLLLLILLQTAACGGGSDGDIFASADWKPGVFEPENRFSGFCETPRSDNNFNDQQGSTRQENFWLRSWSNNTYLWYDEITDQDPGLFDTTLAYFDGLKTNALTPSGNPKDRFHFTFSTKEWRAFNQAGVSAGYGADFQFISDIPPRDIVVSFTEINSPASAANLTRGARILTIDGVDVENSDDVDTINAGLFPSAVGESHQFTVLNQGSKLTRNITLISANITADPVPVVSTMMSGTDKVGYLLFNSHIATAEAELVAAVNDLVAANISDLILDLRYNGGGLLAIASQLAYMIAGPNASNGRVFESLVFNDQHTVTNPFTGGPITPTPFINTTIGFSTVGGQSLPSLGLKRVFVLTTGSTCSASESIINGLRGIGLRVIMIGGTTCGKPYGFFPTDNCGTTYFTVQFKGENDIGFGAYADGFSPANTLGAKGEIVEGCSVADDFERQLGDKQEAMVAAALNYRTSNLCPAPALKAIAKNASATDENSLRIGMNLSRKQVLENKFMTPIGQ